jgi:transposase-like protein
VLNVSNSSKPRRGRSHTPEAVKVQTVLQMKLGANVAELARKLGVDRSLLYYWKYRFTNGTLRASPDTEGLALTAEQRKIRHLRAELAKVQVSLGQKTAELDFFGAALRQFDPTAPSRRDSSATGSMSSSHTTRSRKAQ